MALPVATKESLPIYQNYPDETFLEYLISFTDGNHWYYVGIIVATSYQHKKGTAPESFYYRIFKRWANHQCRQSTNVTIFRKSANP